MVSKSKQALRAATLAEVLLGLGLVAMAFFAMLSVCSLGVRLNEQSMVSIKAAQLADSESSRTVSQILYDQPAGTRLNYWKAGVTGPNFSYPSTPFRTGSATIGTDQLHFAVYATTLSGVGGVAAENTVSRLDTYVWWKEDGPGSKITSCTRIYTYMEDQ
jgi:hypothetical protein